MSSDLWQIDHPTPQSPQAPMLSSLVPRGRHSLSNSRRVQRMSPTNLVFFGNLTEVVVDIMSQFRTFVRLKSVPDTPPDLIDQRCIGYLPLLLVESAKTLHARSPAEHSNGGQNAGCHNFGKGIPIHPSHHRTHGKTGWKHSAISLALRICGLLWLKIFRQLKRTPVNR